MDSLNINIRSSLRPIPGGGEKESPPLTLTLPLPLLPGGLLGALFTTFKRSPITVRRLDDEESSEGEAELRGGGGTEEETGMSEEPGRPTGNEGTRGRGTLDNDNANEDNEEEENDDIEEDNPTEGMEGTQVGRGTIHSTFNLSPFHRPLLISSPLSSPRFPLAFFISYLDHNIDCEAAPWLEGSATK